jgi:hypothetical protein
MTTEMSPDPPADKVEPTALPVLPKPSETPLASESPRPSLPPADDLEFELPGMRFQKDGALKPGLSPPSPISGLDIKVNLTNIGHHT